MTMLSWSPNRRGLSCYASTTLLLLAFFASYLFLYPATTFDYFDPYSSSRPEPAAYTPPPPQPPKSTAVPVWSGADPPQTAWSFDHRRDQRNFGLSDDQCDAAFPDLYREIDRAVAWRKNSGLPNITLEQLDISWKTEMLRAMIYNGQLYVIGANWAAHGMDFPRALAILHSIHRAIVANSAAIPNVEFAVNLGDWPGDNQHKHPHWVLTRKADDDHDKWVMPDFGYWSWPGPFMGEYSKLRAEIAANEGDWARKKPKAVWRGATTTNVIRTRLVGATNGKPWSDVQAINWEKKSTLDEFGLSVPEHCDYQYVLHTEGHSYSGRGKYLLNCESVSIVHTPEWIEPHTHLFVGEGPHQNIVAVARDFADLGGKMEYLLRNPAVGQRVAQNSVAMFRDRYLTPAAQACYWRRLIRAWRDVSFEPAMFETVRGKDGKERKKARGLAFETYVAEMHSDRNLTAH